MPLHGVSKAIIRKTSYTALKILLSKNIDEVGRVGQLEQVCATGTKSGVTVGQHADR